MSAFDGLVLRRTSTPQQLASGFGEMIVSGKMAPGESLNESALAASIGVSRSTIREAVRILERGGLVRRKAYHSAAVVEPSDDELADLYLTRLRLEVTAAGHVDSPIAIAAVETAFEEMARASELRDADLLVERDLGFHAMIVRQLGSRRLDEFFENLTRELRFFLKVLSHEDREYEHPEFVVDEHERILRAFKTGETVLARELITEMVQVNERRVRSIFAERRPRPS